MNELVEKVKELGFKVSKHQIVTIEQFARFILESADFDKHTITPCDFATTDEDDPDEAYERASGWYGIKPLFAGFDNTEIDIAVDHYIGGALVTRMLRDDMSDDEIAKTIEDAIIESLDIWEGCIGADTKIILDWEVG